MPRKLCTRPVSLDDILVLLTSEMGHIGAALTQELRRPKP